LLCDRRSIGARQKSETEKILTGWVGAVLIVSETRDGFIMLPGRELFDASELPVVEVIDAQAPGPVVLVCEHASAAIPASLGDLGLAPEARLSHVAWDPGALAVARRMAALLNAPLVASRVSRLVYDCNRPPDSADAIPESSEVFAVPGNRDLAPEARQRRVAQIHDPFHATVAQVLADTAARGTPPVLVTIHSFTRVYRGAPRSVEIGMLHDSDTRLADAMLEAAGRCTLARYDVHRNAPYGPGDGVTYTLRRHALPAGMPNVMIEIRNDLIRRSPEQDAIAEALARAVGQALRQLRAGTTTTKEG